MTLGKVIVSKLVPPPFDGSRFVNYGLEPRGEAVFHQFGISFEETDSGEVGNFTTAIIEWPDGRVESVRAEHVQFVTPSAINCTAASISP